MKSIQVPATALFIATSIGACKSEPKEEAKTDPLPISAPVPSSPASSVSPTSEAKTDPVKDAVAAARTLDEAFLAAKSTFDAAPNTSSVGAMLLVDWARTRMGLEDVKVAKNETTFERVKKDPDEERGKRMCVSGEIAHIVVKKDDSGKYTAGYLDSGGLRAVHFLAVGSSGDLVEKKRGRFCGAVTGRYSYGNAGGGTTHGIELVGMFDIPENRAKKQAAAELAPAPAPAKPTSDVVKLDDLPDAK